MKNNDLHHIIRFTIPIALETLFTQLIAMIVPALVGGISTSALAAVGLVNQTVAMYSAVFALMSTGGAVLLARAIGSGDRVDSSRIAEQNILLTLLAGLLMGGISLAASVPIMHLLMPASSAEMFAEGLLYFRMMMISFPALTMQTVSSALLRAAGDSRNPMTGTVVLNLVQAAFAALLIRLLDMGLVGAGLSYVIARYIGALFMGLMLLRHRRGFAVNMRNLFRPHLPTWARMVKVGVPNSLESTLVQAGYLIANIMITGLGTHEATVYQVTNTLYGFASYPQAICAPILISFVGQALGAGNVPKAKKTLMGIYTAGMIVSFVLSLAISLCVTPLSGIYTDSADVIADCRIAIWYMFAMCIPAMSINGMDPGLRTGGDSKWIMLYTIFGVWAIRVPLTYLFCYRMSMGVPGLFLANIISLVFRALCSQFRFHTGKWLHINI